MQKAYLVLSEEERDKGFVRPLRTSYRHVGIHGPRNPLQDIPPSDLERYKEYGYVKYEPYPSGGDCLGRYWTQAQLDNVGKGCGTVTVMGYALAETYSRDPKFYGATFCNGCHCHLPVGKDGEFVWEGTDVRVGT